MLEWIKNHKKRCFIIGGAILLAITVLCVVLFVWGDDIANLGKPILTVETPQKLSVSETDIFSVDVTISAMGDALYPAASMRIAFDPSRLEFLGIGEGNVFILDETVSQALPVWSCNADACNETGYINVMYLDITGGRHAFSADLLAEEYNVVLRLNFRLRGSARAGDVYDLTVEDAVFAASDEAQSLATAAETLRIRHGRIVIGE